MSSKPAVSGETVAEPLAEPAAALDFSCIEVTDPDAGTFLQRQTMNDVGALVEPGQAQRNGLLDAKGRVMALFVLFRVAPEGFVLLCPDRDHEAIAVELQRYRLRSKVQIQVTADWQVRGESDPEAGQDTTYRFTWSPGRRIALLPGNAPADAVADAQWRMQDLREGIVHLDALSRGAYTPQMLGLHRWRAFSLSKGCYPGQEIVARTHYLGQQKRELQRIHCTAPLVPGATILAEARELGRVINASDDGEGLAVLPIQLPGSLALASGEAVELLPFAND